VEQLRATLTLFRNAGGWPSVITLAAWVDGGEVPSVWTSPLQSSLGARDVSDLESLGPVGALFAASVLSDAAAII
jgi:hypothetical protein